MKSRLNISTHYILMEDHRQRQFTCKEDQNFALLIWSINKIWYSLSGVEFNFSQININRLNSLAFYNSTKYSMNLISLQRCEESLFRKLYLTPWLRCSRLWEAAFHYTFCHRSRSRSLCLHIHAFLTRA